MTVWILVVIITQWMWYPGYVPTIIVHRNPTLAYQEFAYYRSQQGIVVTLTKQAE